MASITLRPSSASGTSWSNTANVYDGNTSTSGTVSVASNNYADRFLTCNFDTSVIPSGATINSATLTVIAKQSSSYSSRRITPRVDINGDSNNRVINQRLTSTTSTTLTADVTSYISNLTSLTVTPYVTTSRSGTFTLYEVYIDVDYTISQTYTVTFKDWNGDVLKTETVEKGSNATPPSYPIRDGYLCIGWDNYNYTNITSDLDITAQYIQEEGTSSDNVLPSFKNQNETILGDTTLIQKNDYSISISIIANGTVGIDFPYPEEWKGKDVTFSIGNISSNAQFNISNLVLTSSNKSGTVNVPVGNNATMGLYIIGTSGTSAVHWVTDVQAFPTYTITASANTGGSISPISATIVSKGGSQAYTITANPGYRLSDVKVDNVSQGAITTYTFSNVTANHTIQAVFEQIPSYTITASSNAGGSISPDGETVVLENGSQSYSISANTGYGIKDVLIDGVSQGAITSYTFTNVNSNHTIEVVFEPVPTVVAAIEKNVFYAINLFEGYDNFSIGKDGVYLNAIHEDLNENENIYLDSNCILHVFKFIEGNF